MTTLTMNVDLKQMQRLGRKRGYKVYCAISKRDERAQQER